jgi:hypothetical protein
MLEHGDRFNAEQLLAFAQGAELMTPRITESLFNPIDLAEVVSNRREFEESEVPSNPLMKS